MSSFPQSQENFREPARKLESKSQVIADEREQAQEYGKVSNCVSHPLHKTAKDGAPGLPHTHLALARVTLESTTRHQPFDFAFELRELERELGTEYLQSPKMLERSA